MAIFCTTPPDLKDFACDMSNGRLMCLWEWEPVSLSVTLSVGLSVCQSVGYLHTAPRVSRDAHSRLRKWFVLLFCVVCEQCSPHARSSSERRIEKWDTEGATCCGGLDNPAGPVAEEYLSNRSCEQSVCVVLVYLHSVSVLRSVGCFISPCHGQQATVFHITIIKT